MEIRKNNFSDPDRTDERDDERLEGFAASEMADRGPKDVSADRAQYADSDAAAIRPVSNVNGEEGDEDYDDEEDDTDDLIGEEDDDDVEMDDDDDLDEEDFDDDDLEDVDLDEDEDDEDDNL